MEIKASSLTVASSTLSGLIAELGEECQNVTALIEQLKSPAITGKQQADILAELLAAAIHLNVHCNAEFQRLIAAELEKLPDDDEDEQEAETYFWQEDLWVEAQGF
ncbi:MAG: hypothetical protein Fur0025_19120 [Oscillatoriaceae cyanobacterium]